MDSTLCVEGRPAYDASAWHLGGSNGPQCSASGEFCFFCQFREEHGEPEYGEEDDCLALKNMVRSLARQKKELPIIVNTIYRMYEEHVRKQVQFIHPITNLKVQAPQWSRQSIQRHITFSGEFPDCFESIIQQTFHSIIQNQQNNVIDADTNLVIEDRRRALMDTIKHYTSWRAVQTRPTSERKSKRKAIED